MKIKAKIARMDTETAHLLSGLAKLQDRSEAAVIRHLIREAAARELSQPRREPEPKQAGR